MTGKAYYLTTLGAWRKHEGRIVNSHWLALNFHTEGSFKQTAGGGAVTRADQEAGVDANTACRAPTDDVSFVPDETTPILALIEADEGAHLALQDDCEFEALPHPLSQKPVSDAAVEALAAHGVAPGATMFEAAETVARVHPLLRHRVF